MPRKLKVFRTPVGFDDAFVAAPSRKAALAAWGSDADLFARGVAEEVDDPALMAEALADPGKVIRRSRGDLAAQLKALGPRRKARQSKPETPKERPAKANPARVKPPPKRDRLDAAEAALGEAKAQAAEELAGLEKERAAITRRIDALHARRAKEIGRRERARDAARKAYRKALASWSE